MSHFVSSELPDNHEQTQRGSPIRTTRKAFQGLSGSRSPNSSGMFLGRARGLRSRPARLRALWRQSDPGKTGPDAPGRDAVCRNPADALWIEDGATYGYNAQWTARRRTRLATLLTSYADGLPRGAGATDERPGAKIMIAGER